MLSEDISNIIVPLHVISGNDHTSGFLGQGKTKIFKKCINDPQSRQLLQRVGENLQLQNDIKQEMKLFVLRNVYDECSNVTCGKARALKWNKMKKKRTAQLPPDEDSLNQHLMRVNFILYCQLNFRLVEHPSPVGHGWEIINGKCKPVRHRNPALPASFEKCN